MSEPPITIFGSEWALKHEENTSVTNALIRHSTIAYPLPIVCMWSSLSYDCPKCHNHLVYSCLLFHIVWASNTTNVSSCCVTPSCVGSLAYLILHYLLRVMMVFSHSLVVLWAIRCVKMTRQNVGYNILLKFLNMTKTSSYCFNRNPRRKALFAPLWLNKRTPSSRSNTCAL